MSTIIWEFFGYRSTDDSELASISARHELCPYIREPCLKTLSDGVRAGVCTLKQSRGEPVICCPIRLYAESYRILRTVALRAFGRSLELVPAEAAVATARGKGREIVAVFGKRWGKELRLPQREGRGGYFVDWVLALLDREGNLQEFVAVEVQTIDTTGNYRNGRTALLADREVVSTSAGFNWENVSKRILPQLIYKGQILQREELCRKGLFFITPVQVYDRIMARLGGADGLIRYALQPASVTFMPYSLEDRADLLPGDLTPLREHASHSTTVYKMQEAFNNVTLPEENVYRSAIEVGLGLRNG